MSEIVVIAGETRNKLPMAELREGSEIIARVYPNQDGTKIRIVLPELMDFTQTLISIDNHLIEFTRKGKNASRPTR